MGNVSKLRKKLDATKIGEFLEGYTQVIMDEKPEDQPTNILIIDFFKLKDKEGEFESTAHNLWIGGPMLNAVEVAGLLELIKHSLLTNNFLTESWKDEE